jgi:hypothetical protein
MHAVPSTAYFTSIKTFIITLLTIARGAGIEPST